MRISHTSLALCLALFLGACGGGGGGTSDTSNGGSGGAGGSGGSAGQGGEAGQAGEGGQSSTGGSGGGQAGQGGTAGQGGAAGQGGTAGQGGQGGTATGGAGGGDVWGPDQCKEPPAGVAVGTEIGQQLPNYIVKDCDGNDYSLEELCGANGIFLFAASGWCPLCQNVSTNAEALHDSFAGKGLASAIVVIQTAGFQKPGADYCKTWRDKFGLQDVITLYDPTDSFQSIWQNSSSLSVYLDRDRVIVDKLVHNGDIPTIKASIEKALSP